MRREKFGAKSEKLRPDQFHLPLEDVEIAQGVLDAAQEKAAALIKGKSDGAPRPSNRSRSAAGSFAKGRTDYRAEEHAVPVRLRRDGKDRRGRERAVGRDPGAIACAGDPSPEICLPPLFRRRGAGACTRACGAGGLPTEALIVQIIVAKFGDHLPFYRQSEIYARQGIHLDRATLGNWTGRACFHLKPIADHMCAHLSAADRLFMDETTAPVLDPGRGQTKKGFSFGRLLPMIADMAALVRRSCCSATRRGEAANTPNNS